MGRSIIRGSWLVPLIAVLACTPRYHLQITAPQTALGEIEITLLDRRRAPALAGDLSVSGCRFGEELKTPQSEAQVYWHIGVGNSTPPYTLHIRYGVVPEGWREFDGARPLPNNTCLLLTATPLWGPGIAQLAITLDASGQAAVIWRPPPFVPH